jgi:hypothetical protein
VLRIKDRTLTPFSFVVSIIGLAFESFKECVGVSCGIYDNTNFFPFMIMIGLTLHLRVDNYQHSLIVVIDNTIDAKTIVK